MIKGVYDSYIMSVAMTDCDLDKFCTEQMCKEATVNHKEIKKYMNNAKYYIQGRDSYGVPLTGKDKEVWDRQVAHLSFEQRMQQFSLPV